MKCVSAVLAVDTNVVLRFLVRDDEAQSAKARAVVAAGEIFVSPTVILECEWVLRSLYEFSTAEILDALEGFCRTPGVSVGEAFAVRQAFEGARLGLDFADALHLALASPCEAFVTFDKRLAKRAKRYDCVEVRLA